MNQYISSFLIEPVFRQARRFSRPAEGSPQSEPCPALLSNGEASQSSALAETHTGSVETFPPLDLNTAASPIAGEAEVQLPTNRQSGDGEPQAWEDGPNSIIQDSQGFSEVDNSELEVNARRYSGVNSANTSYNPFRGVHDGLSSNTSSFSNLTPPILDGTMSAADPSSSTSNVEDSRVRGQSGCSRSEEGALPADDGMSDMRKRIIAIQRTDSSSQVKAKLVHEVMTEKHNSSQQSLLGPRTHSPGSMHSSEQLLTPSSPKSIDSLRQTVSPPTSSSSNIDPPNPFQLTAEDLKPTYYTPPRLLLKDGNQDGDASDSDEEPKSLGSSIGGMCDV
ncbi:hypothetical protein ACLMJK_007331 [Lecanora helva]